jgi:hypothetical protein
VHNKGQEVWVGEVAALITAISGLGGLVTAIAGAYVLIANTRRMSRRERKTAAQAGADEMAAFVKALVAAAEDGEITPDELAGALEELPEGGDET